MAYKILPAYVAEYQLQEQNAGAGHLAVVNRYPEEARSATAFLQVVKDLAYIPAQVREEIKITATQDVVRIACDYTIPVDLLVYQMNLHFTPSSENKEPIVGGTEHSCLCFCVPNLLSASATHCATLPFLTWNRVFYSCVGLRRTMKVQPLLRT